MSEPAPSKRTAEISQRLREILGPGRAEIFVHSTDDGQGSVAILHANDRPRAGMTVYATLDLNAAPNLVDGVATPVELLGVIQGESDDFANALSTVAAHCSKDGQPLRAGQVHCRVLELYAGLAPQLPHLLLVEPMAFLASAAEMHTSEGIVRGLQVLPISEAEFAYLRANGPAALLAELRDEQIAFWDLARKSSM